MKKLQEKYYLLYKLSQKISEFKHFIVTVNIFNTICEYIVPYIFKDLSYLYLTVAILQILGLLLVTRIKFDKACTE